MKLEELKLLKAHLRYQQRKISEGYFGSSTPSSKKPVKENSVHSGEAKNRGGAKAGHKGNGRRSLSSEAADRVEEIRLESSCPACNSSWEESSRYPTA